MTNFSEKGSGYVAIGVRSVRAKFRGYAVWLGCKNRVATQAKTAVFGRGNYQKRSIL